MFAATLPPPITSPSPKESMQAVGAASVSYTSQEGYMRRRSGAAAGPALISQISPLPLPLDPSSFPSRLLIPKGPGFITQGAAGQCAANVGLGQVGLQLDRFGEPGDGLFVLGSLQMGHPPLEVR